MIVEALKPTADKNFVDLDPLFNMNIDEDFDFRASGITRTSFCNVYLEWIMYCAARRRQDLGKDLLLIPQDPTIQRCNPNILWKTIYKLL